MRQVRGGSRHEINFFPRGQRSCVHRRTGKTCIEAQQKVFDADPDYQLLAIGADAALTYFRWLLARKIEAERSEARAA